MSDRKVFGQVLMPAEKKSGAQGNEGLNDNRNSLVSAASSGVSSIDVVAHGEAKVSPDRSAVNITITSTKPSSEEARSSVQKRLVYVQKVLENNGLEDQDVLVLQELKRAADSKYQYVALIRAEFGDHTALQLALNTFAEKLDTTLVCVSEPRFFVSADASDAVRRRATLAALSNAKRKAAECCRLVGAQLGPAIRICEERTTESYGFAAQTQTDGEVEFGLPRGDDGSAAQSLSKRRVLEKRSWLERFETACVTVQVRVSATFEIQAAPLSPSRSKTDLSVKHSPAK